MTIVKTKNVPIRVTGQEPNIDKSIEQYVSIRNK